MVVDDGGMQVSVYYASVKANDKSSALPNMIQLDKCNTVHIHNLMYVEDAHHTEDNVDFNLTCFIPEDLIRHCILIVIDQ